MNQNHKQPTISGQLSDSELAVEAKIDNSIQSPGLSFDSMTPSATSYAVLKEELGLRSALNRNLQQEQGLAFKSSARRDLHNKAVMNDKNSKETEEALVKIPAMLESGMTMSEVKSTLVKENPLLPLNPTFGEGIKPFDMFVEDDHEIFMREHKEILETQGLSKRVREGHIDAGMAEMLDQSRIKAIENGANAQDLEGMRLQTEKIQKSLNFQEMKRSNGFLKKATEAAGGVFGGTPAALDAMDDFMADNGFPLGDNKTFIEAYNPDDSAMMFLSDSSSIDEAAQRGRFASAEEFLEASLGVMQDPTIVAAAQGGDRDAIAQVSKAKMLLDSGKGIVRRRYGAEMQEAAEAERLHKIDSDLVPVFLASMDKINDIMGKVSSASVFDGDKDQREDFDQAKRSTISNTFARAQSEASAYVAAAYAKHGVPIPKNMDKGAMLAAVSSASGKALTDDMKSRSEDQLHQDGADLGLWPAKLPDSHEAGVLKPVSQLTRELGIYMESNLPPNIRKGGNPIQSDSGSTTAPSLTPISSTSPGVELSENDQFLSSDFSTPLGSPQ